MRTLLFLTLLPLLTGCATVNFSANYFTPPSNYKSEVTKLWKELIYKLPLKYKYSYSMRIVSDKECNTKGIPGIKNAVVSIPDNYIKYMYQNYYKDRFIILTCMMVHELCHAEYKLPDKPPAVHFQTDGKAISLLSSYTTISAYDYYRSNSALKNYWSARKGAAGHAFNIGWNVAQVASIAMGGPYCFVDWFATDLNQRQSLLSKRYGKPKPTRFNITKGPEGIISTEEPRFDFLLAKKETEEAGLAAYSLPSDTPMWGNLNLKGSLDPKLGPMRNLVADKEEMKNKDKEQ